MADKEWSQDIWERDPIDVNFQLSQEEYYGPSVVRSFYERHDDDDGYEVRGLKPVYRTIENPERDSY